MNASLGPDRLADYQRDGIVYPIRVMSEAYAADALRNLELLEAREGGRLGEKTNEKPHILLPWLNELVRHPAILDAVENILGPNILCWASGFFAKSPNDGTFVSWHQDSTYWGLSSSDVLTAWVALTPSQPENGCLRVVPGSHRKDQVPHRDTFADGNLLSRGQEIAVTIDENEAADVILQPGEMSLHHVKIFHASGRNLGAQRRVGFSIRYIPTHVRQISGRTTALLVRGEDAYHHFEPEPTPNSDFHPEAVAFHAHALNLLMPLLYTGADKPAADPP
jgi:hypothetical protein